MDKTKESTGHLISMIGICSILLALFISAVIGQKAWSHKVELTQSFEQCMASAPFKTSVSVPRPEIVLSVDELQEHFDEFDQIFSETGLPPIWNGKSLVPWKIYHKDSIEYARKCHIELGIDHPQKQLSGTYSKPVWDPQSNVWLSN